MKRLLLLAAVSALVVVSGCTNSPSSTGSGSVSTTPSFIAFQGSSTSSFTVTASGSWTASTDQAWLSLGQTSGSGSGNVSVSVDRTNLTPGSYAGTVLVKSGSASTVVTVYMRFAKVSGNITGPSGQILPQSVRAAPAVAPGVAFAPGQVLAKVSAGYLAVQGVAPQSLGGRIGAGAATPQAVRTAAATIAQAHGLSVQSLIAPGSSWALLRTNGRSVAQAVTALRADARVSAAQPNYLLKPSSASIPAPNGGGAPQVTPTDPLFSDQWDMTVLRMPTAWDTDTGSADVVVGVVDTGVMGSHPDLQGNVPYAGYDFVLDQAGATTPASDGEYHGTHVSGTIGAIADNSDGVAGMNWHVSILPVRVCTATTCTTAATMRGIEYAAGHAVYDGNNVLVTPPAQARVINLSLGANGPWPAVHDAVAEATGNGTAVVAAAGNDITNCTNPPQFYSTSFATSPSPVSYPAAYPDTIAVGSLDYDEATGALAVSCFSNNGAPGSDSQGVTVGAPGGWLFNNGTPVSPPAGMYSGGWLALGVVSDWWDNSTSPGSATYASLVGTSMATPHVVGLVALMLAENPKLTPTQVKLMLEATANGGSSTNPYFGYGVIVPGDAITAARNSATANASDFVVELLQGGSVIEQAGADAGGDFTLANVPAGTYTVAGGNDANHNGVLGDVGEFYGETSVTVGRAGDVTNVGLNVQLQ